MRMYCPSLKENVEATITDGEAGGFKGWVVEEYSLW